MAVRVRQSAEKTVLCATRFWAISPSVPTSRAGVRHVVRKQGFTSAAIVKAERSLQRKGLFEVVHRGNTDTTVRLTPRAAKISCATTKLSPWTDAGYPGASLAGRPRRKRARR